MTGGANRAWDRHGGRIVLVAVLVAFVGCWWSVLLGLKSLIPGDILYLFYPWIALPRAHVAGNYILSDLALEIHPWYVFIREQLLHGRLPLWNPYATAGSPLLANGQSAILSPFTWILLPLTPSWGMSLVMLLKLWVAGTGTAVFLRRLGAGGVAAAAGAIAFAASSYMVAWLGWPHTSVAALMPWGFVAAEWYLASRRPLAISALGLVVGLQFLAGHAETSLHFGIGLTIYLVARLVAQRGGAVRPALLLGLGALLGIGLAAAQLLPFAEYLGQANIAHARASAGIGFGHLPIKDAISFIWPNRLGNPGIDHLDGAFPNYNETTGFVGAWCLAVAPLGLVWLWTRARSAAVGLAAVALVAAGVVYGPLSPLAGRLPLLAVSPNERFLVSLDFALACLGGFGVQWVVDARDRVPRIPRQLVPPLGALAAAGLAAELVLGALFVRKGARVDTLFGTFHHWFAFWLLPGTIALACAAVLIILGRWGGQARTASGGLIALALFEALLFAGPYNPRVDRADVPPDSAAMRWMHDRAGNRPVAFAGNYSPPGGVASPETASLFHLRDVASYDPLIDSRQPQFWSAADPRLGVDINHMLLGSPSVARLHQAGVAYVMTVQPLLLPGTVPRYAGEGVTISEVPGSPDRVFSPTSTNWVGNRDEDAAALGAVTPDQVVIEAGQDSTRGLRRTARAELSIQRDDAGVFDVATTATAEAVVVLQESYSSSWVARVDGRQVPLHAANLIRMAAVVPPGRHVLTLRYEPASFRNGVLVSLGSALLLAALPALATGLRRRTS